MLKESLRARIDRRKAWKRCLLSWGRGPGGLVGTHGSTPPPPAPGRLRNRPAGHSAGLDAEQALRRVEPGRRGGPASTHARTHSPPSKKRRRVEAPVTAPPIPRSTRLRACSASRPAEWPLGLSVAAPGARSGWNHCVPTSHQATTPRNNKHLFHAFLLVNARAQRFF